MPITHRITKINVKCRVPNVSWILRCIYVIIFLEYSPSILLQPKVDFVFTNFNFPACKLAFHSASSRGRCRKNLNTWSRRNLQASGAFNRYILADWRPSDGDTSQCALDKYWPCDWVFIPIFQTKFYLLLAMPDPFSRDTKLPRTAGDAEVDGAAN